MPYSLALRILSTALLCLTTHALCAQPPADQRQLARILVQRCLACHGPMKQEGGYRVDTFEHMRKPGDSGSRPIEAGHADGSELYKRLTTSDVDARMPAGAPALPSAELKLVEQWISAGAPIDKEIEAKSLVTWARGARQSSTPEHYPKALPITAVALSTKNEPKSIWTSGYGEALEWLLGEPELKLERRQLTAGLHVSDIDLSSDGGLLAVASGTPGTQGFVEIFSRTDTGFELVWTHPCADLPADLAIAPTGQQIAVGLGDGTLLIGDLTELKHSKVTSRLLSPHADAILAVNWSASGDRLITASRDRTAKIFDTSKWQLIANYDRHERAVGGVAYLDRYPISLDETGKLRLWSGDDSDRTLAERDNQARFLERIVAKDTRVWLAVGPELRSFEIERKTVDDGQDEAGKPKQKTTTRWKALEELSSNADSWLLSVDASAELVAAGNESGQVIIWRNGEKQPIWSAEAKP